ncbi:MAG: S8 family serine peptidase, partial [Bacillota bacterium]|nr:S8 family serine peptidase [Bacillota bacterium]
MRKLALLVSFLLIYANPAFSQNRQLLIPPIPNEETNSDKIAIVLLEKPQTERQINKLLKSYPDVQLRHVFSEAITGFSIKGSATSIEQLAKSSQIIKIEPVQSYQAQMEENIKMIGTEEVRGIFDKNNRRLTGKGVTVGVIDTGVDYTHPDLRRSYGGGHDLVDSDRDPMETKSNQGDATYHGTHVAGIIAADGRIQGVAPEAKIIAYRALGPGGSGTTEQILAAIEMAIKAHVDILNLSLGNEVNGPDLPISMALNRAVDKGIVAVAASGNSGPHEWTVGSPGTASKAISVGASTPATEIPYLLIEGTRPKIKMEPMANSKAWNVDRSMDIIYGGLGTKRELARVKNKIVLIQRGRLTFTEKAKNALEAGARGVIIYNNMKGSFIGNLQKPISIPVASITKNEGQWVKKQIKKGKALVRFFFKKEQDRLADFSSRGPVTGTWEIKPDVVAPGVAINSTVPGGYLSLQGTSMAAPHVAGACALIKQAHPEWTPAQIKSALMNTAKPLFKNNSRPYRTFEQGAGRIQVKEAIQSQTLVIPGSLQFGKFHFSNRADRHSTVVTIENTGDRSERYTFRMPEDTEGLTWKMPMPFSLDPREKRKIEIELAVDAKSFKKKIQDGCLELDTKSTTIRIPYIYVLEEPNYPRVMGFDMGEGDKPGAYRYEVYLPGGAEEFGIALFNAADY